MTKDAAENGGSAMTLPRPVIRIYWEDDKRVRNIKPCLARNTAEEWLQKLAGQGILARAFLGNRLWGGTRNNGAEGWGWWLKPTPGLAATREDRPAGGRPSVIKSDPNDPNKPEEIEQ